MRAKVGFEEMGRLLSIERPKELVRTIEQLSLLWIGCLEPGKVVERKQILFHHL
jgi:hypothetical protein